MKDRLDGDGRYEYGEVSTDERTKLACVVGTWEDEPHTHPIRADAFLCWRQMFNREAVKRHCDWGAILTADRADLCFFYRYVSAVPMDVAGQLESRASDRREAERDREANRREAEKDRQVNRREAEENRALTRQNANTATRTARWAIVVAALSAGAALSSVGWNCYAYHHPSTVTARQVTVAPPQVQVLVQPPAAQPAPPPGP